MLIIRREQPTCHLRSREGIEPVCPDQGDVPKLSEPHLTFSQTILPSRSAFDNRMEHASIWMRWIRLSPCFRALRQAGCGIYHVPCPPFHFDRSFCVLHRRSSVVTTLTSDAIDPWLLVSCKHVRFGARRSQQFWTHLVAAEVVEDHAT